MAEECFYGTYKIRHVFDGAKEPKDHVIRIGDVDGQLTITCLTDREHPFEEVTYHPVNPPAPEFISAVGVREGEKREFTFTRGLYCEEADDKTAPGSWTADDSPTSNLS